MTEQHHTHHNDPSKQKEHMALLDLVPDSKATHIAINQGSWFNANTWKNGQIPNNQANVIIPDGVQVTYDGESEASLRTLRVDGQLDFAPDKNTKMEVDTFVVAPKGTLTIGTENKPIQGDKTARIIIADNGAIDQKWDPEQLSRGIISHGKVSIHGQEKTSHLKLAEDAMTGDTELVLAEKPLNWKVGDTLVLTGTKHVRSTRQDWQGTQDEEVKIAGIEGNRILLDRALEYDHDTPREDLKASVANYSRNVIIETENAESLPANQRGHVMFMHSDDVDVRYAEFYELGRTDKSKLLDDFALDNNGSRILDANGNPRDGNRTNIRGRYALHFHRTGVEEPDSQPGLAMGNAVWGSPGWGYVHHDSHIILEDNAAYNVFGAAFVTETGNETGAWRNNIAIKSEGRVGISKGGTRNHDIAANGTGFWFQGRLVENENNIAAGQRHGGMTYMLRGVDQMDVLAENLPNPETARYQSSLGPEKPEINGFKEGEVFASGMGLEVIKANPRQQHDVRSFLDGFTAWEVQTGTHMEYTSKYTLKDFTVIATESRPVVGISIGNNTEDMVINNAHVEGFNTGIKFAKKRTFSSSADWDFVIIDADLVNNSKDFENFNPKEDKILTQADLKPGTLKLELSPQADFVFSPDPSDRKAVITGVKIDSIGEIEYPSGNDSAQFRYGSLKNRLLQGYYKDSEGTRFITVEELIADRATGELLKLEFVVTLDNSWTEFTLGGVLRDSPLLGVYPGNVQPGFIDDSVQQFINSIASNINTNLDSDIVEDHSTSEHEHHENSDSLDSELSANEEDSSDHEHEEDSETLDSELSETNDDSSECEGDLDDDISESDDEIIGTEDPEEFARTDYLEFIPSSGKTDPLTGEVLEETTDSIARSNSSKELILNPNSDSLFVSNFVDGQDIIQLDENLTFEKLEFILSGENTLIQIAETEQLLATFEGVSASSLDSQDFALI